MNEHSRERGDSGLGSSATWPAGTRMFFEYLCVILGLGQNFYIKEWQEVRFVLVPSESS